MSKFKQFLIAGDSKGHHASHLACCSESVTISCRWIICTWFCITWRAFSSVYCRPTSGHLKLDMHLQIGRAALGYGLLVYQRVCFNDVSESIASIRFNCHWVLVWWRTRPSIELTSPPGPRTVRQTDSSSNGLGISRNTGQAAHAGLFIWKHCWLVLALSTQITLLSLLCRTARLCLPHIFSEFGKGADSL